MAIRDIETEVTPTIGERIVATARYSQASAARPAATVRGSAPTDPAVVAVFVSCKHAYEMVALSCTLRSAEWP